ncbi:prostatic acid phosphatase-like [Achroia grisella]|uniref:prostatic acid phosphatase-like n=1 Tax=Achroia grisella TaxID=688607 RepID=UPI0027D32B1C|nr:prostatic acid phosphatase-like [Achroia grisella]
MRSAKFKKLFALLIIAAFGNQCASASLNDVKYAAVIYRHGDRTPVECYPTDPWRNESLWPVKFGQLTNTGKKQHFALGQWLRERYTHLLSTEFEPTELYVRSTDVDRTLMSAEANLAGMYPPSGNCVWDEHLRWQPIPVHTRPVKDDNVLAMEKPCTRYRIAYDEHIKSKEYVDRLHEYQGLMQYLSAHTGEKVTDYNHINNIYNVLYIEDLYNFTLPNWTQSVYPDKLLEPAGYSFTTNTALPILARLKVGPLLKLIVEQMVRTVEYEKTGKRKMEARVSIFSAHDITVASVLNALHMFDGKCPSYTATVLLELLHEKTANNKTDSYFIRISYRNTIEIVEPKVLYIPYCGEKCPLDRFINLYTNLLTVDWQHECEKPPFKHYVHVSVAFAMILFYVFAILRLRTTEYSDLNTESVSSEM